MLPQIALALALMSFPVHGGGDATMAASGMAALGTAASAIGQTSPAKPADAKPPMSTEELQQLVAPIALYPDALISQILMASTYPLEVIEADRWVKANPTVTGDKLAAALNGQSWDASVKSLMGFPDVLAMLSEKLDMTTKLGDAFISQQKDVLNAIQVLRAKAKDAGNLKSTEQQTVEVQSGGATQTIVIESTSPDVIYVPQYDPVVVYGTWAYPSYPPYYYYPPSYSPGSALIGFGAGLALGAAWGYAWGNCNWGGGDVDIDINRNTNFNTNINRTQVRNEMNAKGLGDGRGQWQHDGEHRRGASYRDNATAQRYGTGTDARAAQAREQYRGRAESGRQDLARGAGDDFRGSSSGAGDRSRGGAGASASDRSRGGGNSGASNRSSSGGAPKASDRSRSGGSGSAFSGSDRSGSSTRQASSRGSSSRSSGGARSSGGGGGGSRGGRGGGGRR